MYVINTTDIQNGPLHQNLAIRIKNLKMCEIPVFKMTPWRGCERPI